MTLSDQEVARNNGTPNYEQLKIALKLHIDGENSKLQSPERCCGMGICHQESKRKQILRWRKVGVSSVAGTWTIFHFQP